MSVQVVVITGAASGIGAAIALRFAKQNASLCITDKNDLQKTSTECQKLGTNKVLQVVADLTKNEDIENIVKCALKEFGKIDVLVNCAGIHFSTNLQDVNFLEKFDNIFLVNLRSVVAMTKAALPALIKSKGCVINISSVCSTLMVSDNLPYTVAKAGLISFTKSSAFELAHLGVRVNCISPGPVKTDILKNGGYSEEEKLEYWKQIEEVIPLKEFVKAEDIAEMAAYLASDHAASITGSDFFVDGGMLLGICSTK